jgi:hypothetical protein
MRMGFVTFFKECSPISSNGKSLGTRATDSSLMRSTQLRLHPGRDGITARAAVSLMLLRACANWRARAAS